MSLNREIKYNARQIMARSRPSAIWVGLVFFLGRWVVNYCDTQITGVRVKLDYDAYLAGNYDSALTYQWPEITFLGGVISVALILIGILLCYGMIFYSLEISRGKPAGIANLLDGFGLWTKALGISILSTIIILLFSVLLIVPGVIAFYNYSLSPMLLYDHPDWGVLQCLRMSREMMRGHRKELFRLQLGFFGWFLLCIIPAAQVYVAPYYYCSQALWYDRLTGWHDDENTPSRENTLDKEP